jgi:hypothetical protein
MYGLISWRGAEERFYGFSNVSASERTVRNLDRECAAEHARADSLSRILLSIRAAEYQKSPHTSKSPRRWKAGRRPASGRQLRAGTESDHVGTDRHRRVPCRDAGADLRRPGGGVWTVPAIGNRYPSGRCGTGSCPGAGNGSGRLAQGALPGSADLPFYRLASLGWRHDESTFPGLSPDFVRPLGMTRSPVWLTRGEAMRSRLGSVEPDQAAVRDRAFGRAGFGQLYDPASANILRLRGRTGETAVVSLIGQRYLIDISGPGR